MGANKPSSRFSRRLARQRLLRRRLRKQQALLRVLLVDLERFSPDRVGKRLAAIVVLLGSMMHEAAAGRADRVLRAAVRTIRR